MPPRWKPTRRCGQSRGTTGGLPEPAAGARRLRQELTAAARRVGGTQLRALLRHRRHEAHAPARTREHSEAAVGSCRRLQPEPNPAPVAGRGHAARVEKPLRQAGSVPFLAVHTPQGFQSPLPKPNLDVLREILRKTTKPNTPLAVPKISYLHHGLVGSFSDKVKLTIDRGGTHRKQLGPYPLF